MNVSQGTIIRRPTKAVNTFLVGSLLGLGAALVGMPNIIAGLRPWHLFAVVAFILVISQMGIASLLRLRINAFDIAFLSFVFLSAIIEYINSSQLHYEADVISVFTDLFYLLVYVTARLSIVDVDSCKQLLRGIIWPALPMSILGVLQLLGVGFIVRLSMAIAPTTAVGNRIERGDSVRAWGLTGHWTGFGGYLTCVVAAVVCVMLIERQTRDRVLRRDVVSLGILFCGVLATLTFSVIISSLAIVLFAWRRLKVGINGLFAMILVAASSALVLGPFIAGRFDQQFDPGVSAQDLPPWLPSTLAYRLVIWERETIPAIIERPFLGWGSGAYGGNEVGRIYPIHLDWLTAESQWFSIAVGYGLLATLLFASLIGVAGVMFIRVSRKSGCTFLAPFVTLWVSLVITSFTVGIFSNRGTPAVFYILLGCAVALHKSATHPPRPLR